MVRHRERTTERCKWDKNGMLAAVRAVREDKMSHSTAAKTFQVPRNTLRRRVVAKENIPKFGQHTAFQKDIEDQLEKHLFALDNIGFGLTIQELRSLVYRVAVVNNYKHPFNNETKMVGRN